MSRLILALMLILAASACASSRNLDDSVSDISTGADLRATLFADRKHDYGGIDVTIYEGRILLTGTMRSEDGRRRLVENAWKSDGVDQVIDEVVVGEKTSFGQGLRDSRIAATLRTRLVTDRDVKSSDYQITVSDGVVFLLGATASQKNLDEALTIARSIGNVNRVVSHVLVRTP